MTKHIKQDLISVDSDAKTVKGHAKGFLTGIQYFAPHTSAGILTGNGEPFTVCSDASEQCILYCLNKAGHGGIIPDGQTTNAVLEARKARTVFYVEHSEEYWQQLDAEIEKLIARANRLGLIPCIRPNGTSDLPKIAQRIARKYPTLQVYDYTKHKRPWERTLPNYHITFSWSGENLADCMDALEHGINVAVPFHVAKGKPLPAEWNGYRVIDGDLTDLRFLDPVGVVVGLRAKGPARKCTTSFVQIAGAQ
jgi:hypothetical protein